MMYVKEARLKVSDTEFDYISFGKGNKPLIMIQGLNTRGIKGSGIMLAFMYRIFSKDYTVYLFDRRIDIWDGMTVQDMAQDIASAMDQLELKNADVIGVSQGGMIGQYLAIDRPDLVNKLVLAVTLSRNNEIVEQAVHGWIEMTRKKEMKKLVEDMASKMYSDRYIQRYKPLMFLLTQLQKPKDCTRFIRLAKSCLTCSTNDDLLKIKCPVYVIGGKLDKIVGSQGSEEIAQKLGCRIHMYEEFGHAVYEEAADFNQRIYDFLMELK